MALLPYKLTGRQVTAETPIIFCLPGFPDDASAFDDLAARYTLEYATALIS